MNLQDFIKKHRSYYFDLLDLKEDINKKKFKRLKKSYNYFMKQPIEYTINNIILSNSNSFLVHKAIKRAHKKNGNIPLNIIQAMFEYILENNKSFTNFAMAEFKMFDYETKVKNFTLCYENYQKRENEYPYLTSMIHTINTALNQLLGNTKDFSKTIFKLFRRKHVSINS